jgi:hypothetical protein
VDVLQHCLGFSRRQGAKVLFDDFSRSSSSRIQFCLFDGHYNHRITASEDLCNAVPKVCFDREEASRREPAGDEKGNSKREAGPSLRSG